MYIATPADKLTSEWTRHQPNGLVLTRLALLAQASLVTLESQLMTHAPKTDYKVGKLSKSIKFSPIFSDICICMYMFLYTRK